MRICQVAQSHSHGFAYRQKRRYILETKYGLTRDKKERKTPGAGRRLKTYVGIIHIFIVQSYHAFLSVPFAALFTVHPNINRNTTQNDRQKETLLQNAEAFLGRGIHLSIADDRDSSSSRVRSRRRGRRLKRGFAHTRLEFGTTVFICARDRRISKSDTGKNNGLRRYFRAPRGYLLLVLAARRSW